MTLIATVLRELMAAGLTGDALIEAVARVEASIPSAVDAQAERRRAKDRERKARLRNSAETAETADPPAPTPSSPNPTTPAPTPVCGQDAGTRELTAEFEGKFWPEYPEKVAKKPALKAYVAARRRGASLEEILAGLSGYRQAKPPDRSWAHAASWLNAERWKDEFTPYVPPRANNANRGGKNGTAAYLENLIRDLERDEVLEEERRRGDECAPRLLSAR